MYRYLVIIDDIWHSGEWETIKKSLPDNDLGSRIVTTSRVNAITDKWRDDFDALVYQIDGLWRAPFHYQMIDMYAGMVGEDFGRYHPIVTMCRGMPLAFACMFSALTKERERQEQQRLCIETRDLQGRIEEQVTRYGIQNTPGFEPLVESFDLSYKDLPHHMLKTCLLYCSIYPEDPIAKKRIYPEDHGFIRDDLVRRWIEQGFVCKEEVAKDYFDELVRRGFFIGRPLSLYPMMRNYLRCKLREHNFITCTSDIPCSPVSRLCIDHSPASSDPVDPLSGIDDWHHVRSLVVLEDAEKIPYKHLQQLRVLDARNNSGVLENQHLKDMCGLHRLRHLLVSGGEGITEIPTEVARLQYLETLEVSRTKIIRLPAEIGDLKQLKTVDVSWNKELTELPREMGNLKYTLETLCVGRSYIREQAWEIIRTLKKLKTLDVSYNPELSGIPRDIGELQQLKNLVVSHNLGITELPKEIGKLQHLEKLNLSRTSITELPREIGNLQRLQILNLAGVSTITKLPRDIGKLQNLEALDLEDTNVRKIPREIGGLKKLKNLYTGVGTLPFEAGQLSKLEGLPRCVRQAWKNSDLVSTLAGEILSFRLTGWIGDGGLIVGTKHMHIPQWIKEHFNNIATLDIRICKLEEQDLEILREMPYLHSLDLRFEGVLRKPVVISSGGFTRLVGLTVDSRVPRITFQEGAMPSLDWLVFEFQFYGGPPNTDPPMGIKHLVSLRDVRFQCSEWYRGDSPCISAIIDVVRKEAREHPNRIRLDVFEGQEMLVFERPLIAESSEGSNEASSSGANKIEEIQA